MTMTKNTGGLLMVALLAVAACSSSSTSPGPSSTKADSGVGAPDAGATTATLFRSWSGSNDGSSPWKCSYYWNAIDLEGGHYGDGNTVILQDTTAARCIMVGDVVKSGESGGVETGTLTLTEKETCPGNGSLGLQWAYSYSLDYAARILSLSTNVCAPTGKAGGGTMVFR